MEDTHEASRGCTPSVRLVPILEEAVRANGIVGVIIALSQVCEARIEDGDHEEDWVAAREYLGRFLYSYVMG
jgi:hypothetical protein